MLHLILSKIYEIPIYIYIISIAVSLVLWTVLSLLFRERSFWKWLNLVQLLIFIIIIIFITLAFRQANVRQNISLIPFSSFELAKEYPDVYQEIALNALLFFPIGLFMPFVLKIRFNHPVMLTCIFALVFSLAIELMQFFFMRGLAEVDDVIFNVIGCWLGSLSCQVSNRLQHNNKD